jgi:CubicO group peptidase (beta-lactamase class C family)
VVKEHLTVAEVMSHRAGLPAVRQRLEPAAILDPVRMADLLAAQAPYWPDAGRLAYHALTYGWLCDAIVRRTAGLSTGELFARRIAGPLGLDAWIGLPAEQEHRVSTLDGSHYTFEMKPVGDADGGYAQLIYENPPLFAAPLPWNTAPFHVAEVPAANGIATARSVARYYSCLASGGSLGDVRVWSQAAVEDARAERSRGVDPFSGETCAFGLGFALQTHEAYLGPVADAFGHGGAGGSTHGAWPDAGIGFSYCMNQMRAEETDMRGRNLLAALVAALDV